MVTKSISVNNFTLLLFKDFESSKRYPKIKFRKPYASSIFKEWKLPSKTQKKRLTKQSRIFLKVTYFLDKQVHTKNSGKIKNIKGKLAKTI